MYTIEYGAKGRRNSMPGLTLPLVMPRVEMLTSRGAIDLRIIGGDGKASDLAQFKLEYRRLLSES